MGVSKVQKPVMENLDWTSYVHPNFDPHICQIYYAAKIMFLGKVSVGIKSMPIFFSFFFWEKFKNFSFEVIQLLIVFLYADWVTLCSQDRGESLGWGCEIRALVKGTVQWKSSDNCC